VARAVQPTMTRSRSLRTHRLRRCTDVLYIPSCALPVDDRHVTSCRESRHTAPDLPGSHQSGGHRSVARRLAQHEVRGRRLARHRPVAAGASLSEGGQPAGKRKRRGRPGNSMVRGRRRGKPGGLGRACSPAFHGVARHAESYCPQRGSRRVAAVGRSRRRCRVHGQLRTAIEASNAEPSHHHSSARPHLAARRGRATADPVLHCAA
jgi:hypothetical protein